MILVAMAMVAIIAMAALSIDVVTLYLSRMEAQRAADAGALAAARVISLSGITGDPSNSSGYWNDICGTTGTATEAAYAAATQTIDRVAPTTAQISIKYSANGASPSASCVGLTNFGINPEVTVQVTRTSLPTFFSRLWGYTGNTVNATATAEALNPSNSASVGGSIVPVWPRCVKPWIVPNYDPLNPNASCTNSSGTPCNPFVDPKTGQIQNPGISTGGGNANGVIGETFWLVANCTRGSSSCTLRRNPIQANLVGAGPPYIESPPNLLYLPAQAPSTRPVAVPSCAEGGAGLRDYQDSIAGCDETTQYQCGSALQNTVDLSENPVSKSDTTENVECLIHEGSPTVTQPDGQDTLINTTYPFQMEAGSSNPMISGNLASGTQITASNSIVSLPIYDPSTAINGGGPTAVTIVGFLQVFINNVDAWGNINVTVLNVAGCGNGTNPTKTPGLAGSSPVPVRLITPP